jgi:hypothetical protein
MRSITVQVPLGRIGSQDSEERVADQAAAEKDSGILRQNASAADLAV